MPDGNVKPTDNLPAKSDASPTMRERKNVIRREMRAVIKEMTGRAEKSDALCEAIRSHPAWRHAAVVAIFAPMDHEPDVELLWRHAEGKTFCYPTIRMGGLDYISVAAPDSVTVGQFGIREPLFDPVLVIPPDTFDLVLVPGAAFTSDGKRLGRGGGFYDRLLSSPGFRALTAGICFDCQIVGDVPMEPHDRCVSAVVTESGWIPQSKR